MKNIIKFIVKTIVFKVMFIGLSCTPENKSLNEEIEPCIVIEYNDDNLESQSNESTETSDTIGEDGSVNPGEDD